MRVICPKCSSCFVVADHMVNSATGRMMRCATCGTLWRYVLSENGKDSQKVIERKEENSSKKKKEQRISREEVIAIDSVLDTKAENIACCTTTGSDCIVGAGTDVSKNLVYEDAFIHESKELYRDQYATAHDKINFASYKYSPRNGVMSPDNSKRSSNNEGNKNSKNNNGNVGVLYVPDTTSDSSSTNSISALKHDMMGKVENISHVDFDRIDLCKLVVDDTSSKVVSTFANGLDYNTLNEQRYSRYTSIDFLAMGVVLVLVASIGGILYGRAQVFERWPSLQWILTDLSSQSVYSSTSLKLYEVAALVVIEKGILVLVIDGAMENTSATSVGTPTLQLVFRSKNGHIVRKSEIVYLSVSTLPPSGKTRFILRYPNPPVGAAVDIWLSQL